MTYDEIKAIVSGYTDLSDVDTYFDHWLRMFEANANKLRVMQMVCIANAAGDGAQTDFVLPDEFLGLRQISVDGRDIEFVNPEQFVEVLATGPYAGLVCYTIRNNKVRIAPAPSVPPAGESYNIEIAYYHSIPPLNGTTQTTNWLSEQVPSAYVEGCLAEAHRRAMDNDRAMDHEARVEEILERVRLADWDARWSGGSL